jgi:hypothetical protein
MHVVEQAEQGLVRKKNQSVGKTQEFSLFKFKNEYGKI